MSNTEKTELLLEHILKELKLISFSNLNISKNTYKGDIITKKDDIDIEIDSL